MAIGAHIVLLGLVFLSLRYPRIQEKPNHLLERAPFILDSSHLIGT